MGAAQQASRLAFRLPRSCDGNSGSRIFRPALEHHPTLLPQRSRIRSVVLSSLRLVSPLAELDRFHLDARSRSAHRRRLALEEMEPSSKMAPRSHRSDGIDDRILALALSLEITANRANLIFDRKTAERPHYRLGLSTR